MGAAAQLFPHHAFVDLETTGLDPASDRVIEVGVLFIDQGRPVQRISRLFRSSAPLPVAIRRLTGIDDAALAGQPPFEQFLPELRAALSGWTVVAHNASFERGFLAELLEEIDAPVLDSCELLHYLYPELDSYSLESMIRWTGIGDRAAHRALKDCEDTFAMLCRALDGCIEQRRTRDVEEVVECLAPDPGERSLEGPEPIVILLAKLGALCRTATSPGDSLDPAAARQQQLARPPGEPTPAVAAWIEEALAREGVSAMEPSRGSAQVRGFAQGAAAFAKKNGCRVSLVVGSDSRLSRLLEEDLPALQVDRDGLRYSFLDEQRHYLCRRRAADVCRAEPEMSHEERAPRAYLRAFLRRSATGDIGRLSYWFRIRYPLLQRLALAARSEPATSLAGRCPHYGECFYHSALARSKRADLLVLRPASAAEWPADYPSSRHVVIDEAHQLESAFSAALSRELSQSAFAGLSDCLLGVGGRGGLLSALQAELVAHRPVLAAPQIRDGAARSRLICLDDERLGAALAELFPPEESLHRRELLLTAALCEGNSWAPVRAMLLELKAHLAQLGAWFSAVRRALPSMAQTRPGLERDVFGAICEVLSLIQCAAEFAAPPEGDRCFFASLDASSGAWKLRSEPIEVSRAFGRLAAQRSVVLSSPALSIGGRNPWVLARLGASSILHRMPASGSEVDDGRPLVLLIDDSPRPFDEEFLDWAASRIGGIATFLGGKVMGVFSSQSRLQQIEDRLRPALERAGLEGIRVSQARRDVRAGALATGRVLLGARGVWHQSEAVPGLACVFIDKLPIEPLSRPVVGAREAMASAQCADGRYRSMPYRLPKALVLLRHWLSTCAGTADQKMVVVIAYPGAAQHREALVEALEDYQPQILPWGAARVRIYETLRPIAQRRQDAGPLPSAATG